MLDIDLGLQLSGVEPGSICFAEYHTKESLKEAGVNSGVAKAIISECGLLYPTLDYFNAVPEDVRSSPTHKMAQYI